MLKVILLNILLPIQVFAVQNSQEFELKYKHYTHKYKRVFKDYSTFQDIGILEIDPIFRKADNRWFVKIGKKWFVFFDNGRQVNTLLYMHSCFYKIRWLKSDLITEKNEPVYQLNFFPLGSVSGHFSNYYFTYNDGVIAMGDKLHLFVRKDREMLPKK